MIYLLSRFFPIVAGFAGLMLAALVIILIILGLALIALPIVSLVLIIAGGVWLFKKIGKSA
ncbi:MAG: hypothetical protein J7J68_05830 [Thermotogaceae bacterium]|nr:hypothetical protein [Thermotogaceae bacterium]